jgi:tRNA (cytidine32/uridine32-2'-O)-methyltransferase
MSAHAVRIVLVDTSHPGNIGAVARAMKNMGLHELVLVRPKIFPHEEATARASGADDVLAAARVVPTVAEALQGAGFVLATTSRARDQYFRNLDVREAAQRAAVECASAPVAILFGAERTGLTNDDVQAAHALLRIPTGSDYASLNLAMAVQIVAYELLRAREAVVAPSLRDQPLATPEAMESMYGHLGQVMELVDFRDRTHSGTNLMSRMRRFLQRAELDINEVNILRGFFTAIEQRRRRAGEQSNTRREPQAGDP